VCIAKDIRSCLSPSVVNSRPTSVTCRSRSASSFLHRTNTTGCDAMRRAVRWCYPRLVELYSELFCQKSPVLTYPTFIWCPCWGDTGGISPKPLVPENLESGAIVWHCLRHPKLSRFDTITACDRQTHRHTDRHTTTAYTALA